MHNDDSENGNSGNDVEAKWERPFLFLLDAVDGLTLDTNDSTDVLKRNEKLDDTFRWWCIGCCGGGGVGSGIIGGGRRGGRSIKGRRMICSLSLSRARA